MNREEIIAELQRVAGLVGGNAVSRSKFKRYGRVSAGLVERSFGTWNKALEAASLTPNDRFKRIADSELEEEFRQVRLRLQKVPTRNEFGIESIHSPGIYEKRFGNWRKAVAHYLGDEAAGLVTPHPQQDEAVTAAESVPRPRPLPTGLDSGKGKRVFGPPLNFLGLRHEPVNEQGVVLLFGMVARELGFLVDAVGTGYPDCRAKRRAKGGYYVEVDIEFEFKSSNFQEHGHDPQACNLIICWEHDWRECPIEVLELKSAIKQLNPNV